MKLLNQSITLISASVLVIIGIWAVVFYFQMIGEIKESVDEGLNNYRRQIVFQAHQDTALLKQVNFKEGFYTIKEISKVKAQKAKDHYTDTLMHVPKGKGGNREELEPFRMLTTAFEDDGRYYQLRVINSMVEKDELIEELFKTTIWLYIALIISILFINNYVLRRVWHPFYHFLGQLKEYRIGSTDHFPKVRTHTREFIDLQKATHTLLRHNLTTFEQQKEFIGNASHELQTPLAIALNKLELLIEKADLKNSQVADIAEVITIIERLTRLNKSLLLLTKIENQQFPESEPVAINKVIRKGMEELEEIAEFHEVSISLKENTQITVEMNPALAEMLLFNLLRNALFYSTKNDRIEIEVQAQTVLISNPGSAALNPDTVFNRFQKSNPNSGGSGLGLSIVKAICEIYGFKAFYHFKNQRHCFQVDFTKYS